MKMSKGWLAAAICLAVILTDQIIKFWVKTHFYWGEDYEIASWFHLRFIQNNGMAFGMELGSKLFLSVFRIVMVGLLTYYMVILSRKESVKAGYMACIALITAGAAGNIIDCVFYGEIFSNPLPPAVAQVVPWGEGYAGLMHGMVVDMFYFPLCSWTWPDWLPWIGGDDFTFFDPVFNFADAAISVGIVLLITCYYKTLGGTAETATQSDSDKKEA
ncbi:MAG: lipoprotein signal peptidase [Muribaculaceae bacterium]|nr:lipoprotein signal peptidase [Muribaculaceae bacterium]